MVETTKIQVENFSPLLSSIISNPYELFVKYKVLDSNIFKNCLAVVGSRRMTNYGVRVVNKIVPELATHGITIVSGFMFGIDAVAHRACLSVGGKTIAVMPCGIDYITPKYQIDLYHSILENEGLIMSEYVGNTAAQKWMFSKRNRIVAGLCMGVLVIEAELNSGSLITANYAREFNRKVFAVPGDIYSSKSEGTNELIKKGAITVTDSEDILTYYDTHINDDIKRKNIVKIEGSPSLVYETIRNGARTKDEIKRFCDLDLNEINVALTYLGINDYIEECNGIYNVS